MANLGGGAEAHARFNQYEYRANSSLVLTTDSRLRDTHEPTGEPETLWGRIDSRSFGDRAVQARPPELEERLVRSRTSNKKRRDCSNPDDLPRKRRRREESTTSVLSLADDVVYRPRPRRRAPPTRPCSASSSSSSGASPWPATRFDKVETKILCRLLTRRA